jgi:hydrogenase/urease accessory protein HupE
LNASSEASVARIPRSVRLCVWCVGPVVVEVGLYASYRGHDARFHWSTHFFVGAAAALIIMSVVAAHSRRAVPLPLVWVLLAHLVAMAPDLAFIAGVAHRQWMDLFVGHVSSHAVPGRNWTWYIVFLAALGAYLAILDRVSPEATHPEGA